MRHLSLVGAIGLFAFAMLSACDDTPKVDPAAIDPYRNAVTQNLAALDEIARQLPNVQVPLEPAPLAISATRFAPQAALEGRVSVASLIEGPIPDGILLDATLLGPEHRPFFDMPIGDRGEFLARARRHVATREPEPGSTPHAVQDCQRVASLKTVIVLRTAQFTPPRIASQTTFAPGEYTAVAFVFEVAGGHATFLGGFRYGGTNSPDVAVRFQEARAELDQQSWLASDLKYNVYRSLFESLRALAPRAQLPPIAYHRSVLETAPR